MKELLKALVVLLLVPSMALGGITYGSGDQLTVKAWHDDAGRLSGDVYVMEPGEWEWTSANAWTITKDVVIFGSGWGESGTILEYNRNTTGSGNATRMIRMTGDEWRFSNLEIRDDDVNTEPGNTSIEPIIYIQGSTGFVFDHVKFPEGPTDAYRHLAIRGSTGTPGAPAEGLFWACEFLGDSQALYHYGADGGYGDVGWNNAVPIGNAGQIVFEGCTFGYRATFDGTGGGVATIRYSTFIDSYVHCHGAESGGRQRSHRFYEVYGNTSTWDQNSGRTAFVELRGGSAIVWGNTITQHSSTGNPTKLIEASNYRLATTYFRPWGMADGKNLWDVADTNDGAGTPGGAGDGVYDSGTLTTVTDATNVTDSSKSGVWSNDQWNGYIFRQVGPTFTAASGSSGNEIIVDPAPGWTDDQWNGWWIRDTVTGRFNRVSDTQDNGATDSIFSDPSATDNLPNFSVAPGDTFEVYRAVGIRDTTSSGDLVLAQDFEGNPNFTPTNGISYEIRLVAGFVDGIGMGTATSDIPGGDAIGSGEGPAPIDLGQDVGGQPIYEWDNSMDGAFSQVGFGINGNELQIPEAVAYFVEDASFDGSSGVGIGTKADIEAGGDHETASTTGVGYWVTDESDWNSEEVGTDGQLYQWNGAAWVLYYTPLEYPHPLRATLDPLPGAPGAAYGGRLRFNGTGAKPVRTDGTGQPIIFDQ